eukprot:365065-Chlamydomonas_euryale.AAC.3
MVRAGRRQRQTRGGSSLGRWTGGDGRCSRHDPRERETGSPNHARCDVPCIAPHARTPRSVSRRDRGPHRAGSSRHRGIRTRVHGNIHTQFGQHAHTALPTQRFSHSTPAAAPVY